MSKRIESWEELAECTSETHNIRVNLQTRCAWVEPKDINNFSTTLYITAYTFCNKGICRSATESLQKCGFDVELVDGSGDLYPKKYRKRPVVVTAYKTELPVIINTLEGDFRADVGDYIITGGKGERYPCKPDVFKLTYEPVEYDTDACEGFNKVNELKGEIKGWSL